MGFPYEYRRPINEQDWQRWCTTIYAVRLDAKNLRQYGRRGQQQHGIDLLGSNSRQEKVAVQAKLRNNGTLSTSQIDADIRAAEEFDGLSHLRFATTQPRDTKLLAHVLDRHVALQSDGKFGVEIDFWEDICCFLDEHPEVANKIYDRRADVESLSISARQVVIQSNAAVQHLDVIDDSAHISSTLMVEITEAIEFAKSGKATTAIERLKQLKDKHWDCCTSRDKYLLLANIGNAYYANDDFEQAGRFFLDARAFCESVTARSLEARGNAYLGRRDLALSQARAILKTDPLHRDMTGLIVQLTDEPLETTHSALPETLRLDGQINAALFFRAVDAEDLAKAEVFARNSLSAEPEWPVATLNLATVLLMRARRDMIVLADAQTVSPDTSPLEEALNLFSSLLDQSDRLSTYLRCTALYNRSSTLKMLNRREEAWADLEEAVSLAPQDRRILTTMAVTLEMEGNTPESRRRLTKAITIPADDVGAEMMLAFSYRDEGTQDAMRMARQTLESVVDRASHEPREHRFEFARLLCDSRVATTEGQCAAEIIVDKDIRALLPGVAVSILECHIDVSAGRKDEAMQAFDAALTQIDENVTGAELLALGSAGMKLKRSADVARAIRSRVDSEHWTPLTELYLHASFSAEMDVETMRLCESLRSHGVLQHAVMGIEAGLRDRYEQSEVALSIVQNWLGHYPDDIECRIFAGNLAIDVGAVEVVEDALRALPGPANTDPRQIVYIYRLLVRSGSRTSEDILRWAYQVWRCHRQEASAWRILALSAFDPTNDPPPSMPSPEVVGIGSAVHLRDARTGERQWRCIVEADDADAEWFEVSSRSEFGQQLLGKAVGDVFKRENLARSELEIVAIHPIEVIAASECMNRHADKFPDEHFVEVFKAPPLGHDPKPEEVKAVIQPMVDFARRTQEFNEGLFKVYEQGSLTLAHIANAKGGSVLEVVGWLCVEETVEIQSATPELGGIEAEIRRLADTKSVVIDESTIATLDSLGIAECALNTIHAVIPVALIRSIERVHALARVHRHGGGVLTTSAGQPALVPFSAENTQQYRERLKRLVELLKSHAEVVDGMALAECPLNLRKVLKSDAFNDVSARVLAIARTSGIPLLTDDAAQARFAHSQLGVPRASSTAVIAFLEKRDVLSAEEAAKALAKLDGWGYTGVPVGVATLKQAMTLAEWNCEHWPASRALRVFGYPHNDAGAIAWLLCTFARAIWRLVASPGREEILRESLMHLSRRPDGYLIGRRILTNRLVEGVFGLDVVAAAAVRQVIDQWLKSRDRRDPDTGLYLPP